LDAALLVALQKEARHFLNEQWHAPSALGHTINDFLWERVAGSKLANHLPYLLAVEWGKSNHSVMRAHPPWGPELWPSGHKDEQRCERPAFGDAAQDIKRGWVRPVQVFERQYHRLNPRSGNPVGQRR
jgi:hypothetical protein